MVENWNSANAVICYGKASELTGADREDQEVTMLALHLLQSALVLINTIFLQRVLNEPEWAGRLTEEDRRALTPLFWTHVKPLRQPLLADAEVGPVAGGRKGVIHAATLAPDRERRVAPWGASTPPPVNFWVTASSSPA